MEEGQAAEIMDLINANLPNAYRLLTMGEQEEAARAIYQLVAPSTLHLGMTCSAMASVASKHVRSLLPANPANGDYYAFRAVNPATNEEVEADEPGLLWASRFLTSACNNDDETGWALFTALAESGNSEYVMDSVINLFLQTWRILSGTAVSAVVDSDKGPRNGLVISQPDTEEP
jgi:hypothetical protein